MTDSCACKCKCKCKSSKCDNVCNSPPRDVVCYTCIKPLYETLTYPDICYPNFNVVINQCNRYIEGFLLTFLDTCGDPICFDDYESYMSIETLTGCGAHLVSCDNKIYYTYTEQAKNYMPINPALWTYHYPTTDALRLAFDLKKTQNQPTTLMIIMFYTQGKTPQHTLEPVINHAVHTDLSNQCVRDPYTPGHIAWMLNLVEPSSCNGGADETSGYPVST